MLDICYSRHCANIIGLKTKGKGDSHRSHHSDTKKKNVSEIKATTDTAAAIIKKDAKKKKK